MSEETQKITTVKREKDPKRVESGKRLAAISKEAKERKMRKMIESENKQKDDTEDSSINYGLLLGAVGAITALGALYYARKEYNRQTKQETTKEEVKHVNIQKDVRKCNTLDCL